jgi:hypothetical protein
MDIQTVTVEFLRAGPRHNQLLSPITQYLGVCENAPASRVTFPYEHGDLESLLQELRYAVPDDNNKQRASEALERAGRDIAEVLSKMAGVSGRLDPKQDRPQTLTHLRIVLSASELAMLPFEASKVPAGSDTGAGGVWLALQSRAPVCITRHIRSVSNEGAPWPTLPRVLFIAGPDTPMLEHQHALETALNRWRDDRDGVAHLLEVLKQPKVADISEKFSAAAIKGKPFTHVHVLAHGRQSDERDRYSRVVLELSDSEEPVRGDRLASALTAATPSRTIRPAVVTLASCDSAQQVDVRTADAAIAHELHGNGIPLVVASQFPLSVEGSIPFVARFYEGQLRGEHPLLSLYAVRLDLHSRMDADTHDWASLVAYEALPVDLSEQLEELRYWQARRAQENALKRLESLAGSARARADMDAAWKAALTAVDERIAELPTLGPYALECAGLRAAALKRVSLAALEHAAVVGSGKRADVYLGECRRRLNDARLEYWRATKAYLPPSTEQLRLKSNLHWLLGQVISIDVVLGQPLDEARLAAAWLAAQVDLDSAAAVDRAWAHVSLTEFNLLRLTVRKHSKTQRKTIATSAFEHAQAFIDLVGPGSEHVTTAARQIDRYISRWGNRKLQPLLGKLGIPKRPHWHVEHGLIQTATKVVEELQKFVRERPAEDVPTEKESPAINVLPPTESLTALALRSARPGRSVDQVLAVEMLPAEYGDCLLLEYGDGAQRSRVLIDCGDESTVPVLARRLGTAGDSPPLSFDLFVLTHIDADHINGVLSLFDQKGLKVRFDDIWFNGWHQLSRFLSVRQGEAFSKLLQDPVRKLPWNLAFSQKTDKYPGPAVMAEGLEPPTLKLPGGMQLTLLSPGPAQLKRLAKDWRQVRLDLQKKAMLGRRDPPAPVKDLENFDLRSLAEKPVKRDPSAANGSSIALLAEFAGRSVLLTGDAHADVLVKSIGELQRARGCSGQRLKIDALKLSHHGSANATTIPLLEAIECKNYLVSTNGKHFYHPDRESIARVILHGGEEPTLHFNYRTDFNKLWNSPELKDRYRYLAYYPEDKAEGLRVDL